MSYYIRLLGCGLIMIAALLIDRSYSEYRERRLSTLSELSELFAHAQRMISQYLCYGVEIWRGFSSPALEESGMLALLRGGSRIDDAILQSSDRLTVDQPLLESLCARLSSLGKGYLESELKILSECGQDVVALLEKEKGELKRDERSLRALLVGGALGIMIYII